MIVMSDRDRRSNLWIIIDKMDTLDNGNFQRYNRRKLIQG